MVLGKDGETKYDPKHVRLGAFYYPFEKDGRENY